MIKCHSPSFAEHPFQRLDELLPWNWKKTQATDTLAA
jgi:hypothetical protein